jgi:hypothetical protein
MAECAAATLEEFIRFVGHAIVLRRPPRFNDQEQNCIEL